MTDLENITSMLPTADDVEAKRKANIIFHTEAVRAGLFQAASDIAKIMSDGGVEDSAACLCDGAVEFVAQLWDGMMQGAGNTPLDSRKALERKIKLALSAARRAAPATEQ